MAYNKFYGSLQFPTVVPVPIMTDDMFDQLKARKFYSLSFDEKKLILSNGRPTPIINLSKENRSFIRKFNTIRKGCMMMFRGYVEIFQITNCTAGRAYYFQKKTLCGILLLVDMMI